MKIYFIKKAIQAKNIKEAIQRERSAPITDIWQEEPKKEVAPNQLDSAIGFQYLSEDEES